MCVLGLVGAALAATDPALPAVVLAQSGHWTVEKNQKTALHVHGGTEQVDARVALPDDAAQEALSTLQGDTEGFVVGRDRSWAFDKSTLVVAPSVPLPVTDEEPVGIETPGGPYLVYRGRGTIVRLGAPQVVKEVGGPLGQPVRTNDGTVWVHRPDNGTLCALRRDAVELDCQNSVDAGAPGGLTIVGDAATFVDTLDDTARQVRGITLAAGTALGADLPDDSLLADQATPTRLPVVVPSGNTLRLLDATGILADQDAGPPIDVSLGLGAFSAPFVSGDVIAVLELRGSTLVTFDSRGTRTAELRLPPGTTAANLHRGEDGRLYVDENGGTRTHVIRPDGSIASIDLGLPGGHGNLVAGAAPEDLLNPVSPPPPGQVIVPIPGPGGGILGGSGPAVAAPGPGILPNPGSGPNPGAPNLPPPVTPPTSGLIAPAPPVNVSATLNTTGGAAITWANGAGGGPAESYTVTNSGGGTVTATGRSAAFPNLVSGTTYRFTVTATNKAGTSAPSAQSNSVTPGPVAQLAAESPQLTVDYNPAGSATGTATLRWTQPDLHGGTLVRYEVTKQQSGGTLDTREASGTTAQFSSTADFDACSPVVFGVYAVTRSPSGGQEVDGKPAVQRLTLATCNVPSTLRLSPANDTVATGQAVTFTIRATVGSRPINAIQANLSFPTAQLDCGSIAVKNPPWGVTAENTCSGGEIRIAVGSFGPVTGTVDVATVTLTAAGAGAADVNFTGGTSVLAHGDAAETLGSTTGGTYTVTG
jgi:hypothetical protein